MALPSWPAVPSDPQSDSFQSVKRMLDPIKTEMEGGNVRLRSRPGDNVGLVGQTIIMTLAQHDVFQAWVKNTLSNATARFTAPVWLGSSFQTKVCQFSDGAPRSAYYGPQQVAVTMTLRVFDV